MKLARGRFAVVGVVVLAIISFVAVLALVYLEHDLRGYSPNDPDNPATIVESYSLGGRAFAIADCVPGSIDPYDSPSSAYGEEFPNDGATVSLLTCRSRLSANAIWLAYFGALAATLGFVILIRQALARRRKPESS